MADNLPAPPVPADADLTHYDDMPLSVRRLRDSGIAGDPNAEGFRCAVLLWCVAWHQVPAGSLPDDDDQLCRLVGLGRDQRTWRRIRGSAMRGWRLFADGRLYHRVVAEKVIEGWNRTRQKAWAMACDRARKENRVRKDRGEPELGMPEKPAVIPLEWPADDPPTSDGNDGGVPSERRKIPSEKRLKGIEGNGREGNGIEDSHDAAASGGDAARARADGVPPEKPPDPVDEAFAAYQRRAALNGWPEVQFLNTNRRFAIEQRLRECDGPAGFNAALDAAETAEFLKGQHWFDLDWMLKPENFTRLMEGRYAQRHRDDKPSLSSNLAALADWGREGTG